MMMPPGSQLPPQMMMQVAQAPIAAAPGIMNQQAPNYQQPQMTQAPQVAAQQPAPPSQQAQPPAPEPAPEKPKEVETAELISFD